MKRHTVPEAQIFGDWIARHLPDAMTGEEMDALMSSPDPKKKERFLRDLPLLLLPPPPPMCEGLAEYNRRVAEGRNY